MVKTIVNQGGVGSIKYLVTPSRDQPLLILRHTVVLGSGFLFTTVPTLESVQYTKRTTKKNLTINYI